MKYVANDGTEFNSEKECKEYEDSIDCFWAISFKPDLTEGRCMQGTIAVNTAGLGTSDYTTELYLMDWCYRHIGKPVEFVMGVSPINNYSVTKATKYIYDDNDYEYIKIEAIAKLVNNRAELEVVSAINLDYKKLYELRRVSDFNDKEKEKINEIMSVVNK
jgi:hypothetical protein